jgi:lipopolysaccharide export LptBFGC system permease protein LptF
MPVVILGFVFLANSIIVDIKQNDKFTKVIVTSFLLIFVYYFFSNLMNALGSNSKLPPFLSTLITPLLLFVISIAFNKYKTLSKKI